jgi:hypothetical protein
LLPRFLREKLLDEGANVMTLQLMNESINSLKELDALDARFGDKVVIFFEPPSIDDRIVNQFAFCSVTSDSSLVMDDWLATHPELARKIIIPASLKWEIRDKLDQANINERVLFPGLDGLSRWLKRHYSSSV